MNEGKHVRFATSSMLSPGLSPIHNLDKSINNSNNKEVNENSNRIEIENNCLLTPDNNKSNSYISYNDSTLHSLSLLHESDETDSLINDIPFNISDNNINLNKDIDLQTPPRDSNHNTNHDSGKFNKSYNFTNKTNDSSINTNKSMLKPGAIFTIVLDDNGSPVMIPLVLDNNNYTQRSVYSNIPNPITSPGNNSFHKSNDQESYQHTNKNILNSNNRNMNSSNKTMNSIYFKDRLRQRAMTSILSSPYFKRYE